MTRKTPIRHRVKPHSRKGKSVHEYARGKGSRSLKITKKKIIKVNQELIPHIGVHYPSYGHKDISFAVNRKYATSKVLSSTKTQNLQVVDLLIKFHHPQLSELTEDELQTLVGNMRHNKNAVVTGKYITRKNIDKFGNMVRFTEKGYVPYKSGEGILSRRKLKGKDGIIVRLVYRPKGSKVSDTILNNLRKEFRIMSMRK